MPGSSRFEQDLLVEDHPVAFSVALVLWALGGVLFVALAVPATAQVVDRVDEAVFELVVDLENDIVVAVAKALDFVGSTWVITPVILIVLGLLVAQRRWRATTFWIMAMVSSQLLIGPVKALYDRERPPDPLVETTGASFPSGHAVAATAVALSLVIAFVPVGPTRRNLELVAAGFAVLMALSRVYLRAHWLSDVAAGAALGAAAAVTSAALVKWYMSGRSHGDPSDIESDD